jgi:hypothetical protein
MHAEFAVNGGTAIFERGYCFDMSEISRPIKQAGTGGQSVLTSEP